jgi:cytochrome c-type biogenesis protein CcmH
VNDLKVIMIRAVFFLLLFFAVPFVAAAKEAQPVADDPALEKRLMALSQQLRCLVCQNETLADSQADLAADLRRQIKDMMKQGKSDQEIIAFLTERYGDFVLYKPPVKPTTYLLWYGPFALLGGGFVALFLYLRQRRGLIEEHALTAEERKRAEEILKPQKGPA